MICANNYRIIVQQPVVIAVSPKTEESFKLGNNGWFTESLITNQKLKSIDSPASTMEDIEEILEKDVKHYGISSMI
jgi:hypothetical protein